MDRFSVNSDSRLMPFGSAFAVVNKDSLGHVPSVLVVLAMSASPEVLDCIVGWIAIDVINLKVANLAVEIDPDQAMSKVLFSINSDNAITQSVVGPRWHIQLAGRVELP